MKQLEGKYELDKYTFDKLPVHRPYAALARKEKLYKAVSKALLYGKVNLLIREDDNYGRFKQIEQP